MPRKKKPKRFRAVEAVKALARERVGTPKASRIVVDRKQKAEKRKPSFKTLLDDDLSY